jgi:ABC-type transport system involved in multi-copper enzyme maturation permease subunit
MLNLLRHLISRHGLFLVVSIIVFGGFEFFICAVVVNMDLSGAIQQLMKSFPPAFQSLLSEQIFAGFTTRGILAFGWNHPIAHAVGLAVAIIFSTRAIAGEIENGMMETVLSQPLSRMEYLATHGIFAFISLALLTLGGLAGSITGQAYFKVEAFTAPDIAKLGMVYFLFQLTWFGVSLAGSSMGREGGRVAVITFVVALVSYLVSVIGKLLPAAEGLLPFSLHTYYSPQTILVNNTLEGKSILVLLGVIITSITFSTWYFHRRDIP